MELKIALPKKIDPVVLTGTGEQNLKIMRHCLDVKMAVHENHVHIQGQKEAVGQAGHVMGLLIQAAARNKPLGRQHLVEAVAQAGQGHYQQIIDDAHGNPSMPKNPTDDSLAVYLPGRRIQAKTAGQLTYLRAIGQHDLTFCCGPAGTGKTYLAVAAAVAMLKQGQVRRLALVRPAVEAGEKLGFLPGDMQEKVNPYLRPLMDALHDMMELEQVQRFMSSDVIEIIPLAFMRGRTLNDTAIILDEAQNTTASQMLMFLTRLGQGSKMIVTGDTTQTDLPDPTQSGLVDAASKLKRLKNVAMMTLTQADIVRHSLVQKIVEAYGKEG